MKKNQIKKALLRFCQETNKDKKELFIPCIYNQLTEGFDQAPKQPFGINRSGKYYVNHIEEKGYNVGVEHLFLKRIGFDVFLLNRLCHLSKPMSIPTLRYDGSGKTVSRKYDGRVNETSESTYPIDCVEASYIILNRSKSSLSDFENFRTKLRGFLSGSFISLGNDSIMF